MPEGWYERIVKEFEDNPKLACLSGPYIYYDIPRFQKFLVWCYWYIFGMPMYFLVGYMITGGNFAIRKEVLKKMNGLI